MFTRIPVFCCVAALTLVAASAGKSALADDAGGPQSGLLHSSRSAPTDLEVSGLLRGLPPGASRFVSYQDLLKLPQVAYTVANDANFKGNAPVSGVALDELARALGALPEASMVVAVCVDQYRSFYTRSYMAAHHPLLVLKVNGKPQRDWPKDPEHGSDMGPYLISNPAFTPSFKVLAHEDEQLIPWGVVRIEFRDGARVLVAIAPRLNDPLALQGYRIAQQNCLRCHNLGPVGGTKAGHSWLVLAAWAKADPGHFMNYIRDPRAVDARSSMPGNPNYDEATVNALRVYFSTFIAPAK